MDGPPDGPEHPPIRARLERLEDAALAPYAAHSARSAGRASPEEESPVRTVYQRDRDRIVHSNAFRRLRGKTQVFIAPAGDHYATRLSHALEVAQISRVISRALALNEDLAEAIALAHDLGHAPFGHAGQRALDELLRGGYRHDVQSLRVVQYLERDGRGLNLTLEVLDGIRTHRKPRENLAAVDLGRPATLEAQVVRLSDAVAYINHDVDDALRAGLLAPHDLPGHAMRVLGTSRSRRIDRVVRDIVDTSVAQPEVRMSDVVLGALNELRDFLFERVYTHPAILAEARRAEFVVSQLFANFVTHPDELPESFQLDPREEGVERRVADYIAGMTDGFARAAFERLFVPRNWPL